MAVRAQATRLPRWGGVDQRVTEALLGLVTAVAAMAVPATAIQAALADRLAVHVELAERAARVDPAVAGRFALRAPQSTEVVIHDPQFMERLAYALPRLLTAVLIAIVAWQLMQVFRSLRVDQPFSRGNALRVTFIALTVFVGGAVWAAVDFASAFYLATHTFDAFGGAGSSPVTLSATFTAAPMLFGAVVAGLAEFFRRGAALSEDVDGLV